MEGNISDLLAASALLSPRNPALILAKNGSRLSFAEFDRQVSALTLELLTDGITAETRVLLMAPPSFEFFVTLFALFRLGAIPVLMDPGMGLKNLSRCIALSQPDVMMGIAKAHVARVLFGWQRGRWERVYTMYQLKGRLHNKTKERPQSAAEKPKYSPAAILFTSGSTGTPKGVIYHHQQFFAQISLLRKCFGIEAGEIDVGTFPLFALFAPALGMTAVIPHMDFTRPGRVNPTHLFDVIDEFHATSMFGSPAVLKRLALSRESRTRKLLSLKRVISAGAPVHPRILEKFSQLLAPEVPIYTPYGATEALPIATISSKEILQEASLTKKGSGILIGRPVEGTVVKIIPSSDEIISDWSEGLSLGVGEVGEIVVAGEQVTASYDRLEKATAVSKIRFNAPFHVMHRTGDLGYWDHQGRLWFCGRKSHRVITPEGHLDSTPCEGIFDAHPLVSRSALVGRGIPGKMEPILCVEPIKSLSRQRRQKLKDELLLEAQKHASTQSIREIYFFSTLPVDPRHNAKILREKLKIYLDKKVV